MSFWRHCLGFDTFRRVEYLVYCCLTFLAALHARATGVYVREDCQALH